MGFDISTIYHHGTNAKFDQFALVGQRLPSLGYGYYFTPNIEKAKGYGKNVMSVYIRGNILDWNKLHGKEKQVVTRAIIANVPKERLAGFLEPTYIIESDEDKAEALYEKLQRQTKHYYHDRAKATLLSIHDVPDYIAAKAKKTDAIIRYVKSDSKKINISNAQLLALAQEYYMDVAKDLRYDGAKYGDELCMYKANHIRKIEAEFDPKKKDSNNLTARAH